MPIIDSIRSGPPPLGGESHPPSCLKVDPSYKMIYILRGFFTLWRHDINLHFLTQFFYRFVMLQLVLTVSRYQGLCHLQDIAHALCEVGAQ